MGEDVGDLADGRHVASVRGGAIEQGRGWRGDRIVAAVCGAPVVGRRRAHKWPGDDAPNEQRIDQLARNLAYLIEPIETEYLLVRRNLEHAISRCVTDRPLAADVFGTQLLDDLRSAGVAIAQNARQPRALAQRFHELRGEAGLRAREIAPVERDGDARDFPVPRRRILALPSFARA